MPHLRTSRAARRVPRRYLGNGHSGVRESCGELQHELEAAALELTQREGASLEGANAGVEIRQPLAKEEVEQTRDEAISE